MNETVLDIMTRNMPEYLTVEAFQDFNSALCYRCVPLCLMFDCIRRRLGGLEREISMDKFGEQSMRIHRRKYGCEPGPKTR